MHMITTNTSTLALLFLLLYLYSIYQRPPLSLYYIIYIYLFIRLAKLPVHSAKLLPFLGISQILLSKSSQVRF
ncbi:hypothetical protein L6164_023038 [Bauhinia variegata]|uniref:Uncharacterized protein n=1 Tax=Bauhinia variegata TaxID=167791 RepID=A0ACB9MIH6_BAUVA|nr:hypothetical protein L6164_023038 [Bauhinia variegata]